MADLTRERYDHSRGRDWPAMRGDRIQSGDYVAYVSDCGHVDLGEAAGSRLADVEALLAVLSAAAELARERVSGTSDGA